MIEIEKSGKEWLVIKSGEIVFSSSDYAKAAGVFEYASKWHVGAPLAIIEKQPSPHQRSGHERDD